MTVTFTVHTVMPASTPGWVRVVVHDTVEDLRAAATAYARRNGDTDKDHSDTMACFQGREFRVRVGDDQNVDQPAGRYAGVIRLLPEQGVATLAHEVTHAAVAMYYRQHAAELAIDRPMSDEEVLCYTVGDLVGGITTELKARGVWP